MSFTAPCPARLHGSSTAVWAFGCRCVSTARLRKSYHLRRARGGLRGRVDSTPIRRRIQAWLAVGWTLREIAGWLDLRGEREVWRLLARPTVPAPLADRVVRVFSARSMVTPRLPRPQLVARARRFGWVSELAWEDIDDLAERPQPICTRWRHRVDDIDEIAVDQALAGWRSYDQLTRAETRVVVEQLVTRRRWSDPVIADWLCTTERTVLRNRVAQGVPAVPLDERRYVA